MIGYVLAIFGFAVALILLWAVFSRRGSAKEEIVTYTCAHCGDRHCICKKEPSSKES